MGMKVWRKHAADIFTKHGEIAAKMKFPSGLSPQIPTQIRDVSI